MAALPGPTFLGIGAQKAGTTWLHKLLSLHPDIGMSQQKELHFWDRETLDAAGITAYRERFAGLRGKARGEITPSYAILPPERIRLLKQHFPELKLIYVLRNPLERAWSQAKMELSKRFPQGVPPEVGIPDWLAAHFHSDESLSRGDYAACLKNWLAEYPARQLKAFIYEEELRDPRAFLAACSRHLGVDPEFYAGLDAALLSEPVYPEVELLKIPRLDLPASLPREYALPLVDMYASQVRAAGSLLGRDLQDIWLRPYR